VFRRLPDLTTAVVPITIDGRACDARAGESVAAAMLAAGVSASRTTAISATPRGPYCMMGVCFDCLVTIDGEANRQGCLTQVQAGMTIDTQHGKRELFP